MKFEEYIRNNREKLQPPIDKEAIWDRISNEIPPAGNGINYKLLFAGSAILIVALCSILFYSSRTIGKHVDETNQEIIALKSEINTLINKEETSSRILAVSMSEDIASNDQEIIATLINSMINDSSPNVQLAAVRALEKHTNDEAVRIAMIETLGNTTDAYLQIKLIDILSLQNEQRLLPYLDSIIKNDNRKSIVLDRAAKSKKMLKEI